jgi:pyruvate formate lyase activating enzyme
MPVEIKGFIDLSLVDWDGKVSCVIFLARCNFRCPYCFNAPIVLTPDEVETIPFDRVKAYLNRNRGTVDGVVISGGEPTINDDLPDLCRRIKQLGFQVKLDTNGSNPDMVGTMVDEGLLDYVAVDIKAPLSKEKYEKACGVKVGDDLLRRIKRSIDLLTKSRVPHEFRTTVVPNMHTKEDVRAICETIKGCAKYVIQNFMPVETTVNRSLAESRSFTQEELLELLKVARERVPNARLRGYISYIEE